MFHFMKAAVVAAVVVVPPLAAAHAQTSNSATGASQQTEANTASSDSDFEKTRQHMIEMNKESQRTGKM